MSTRIRGIEEDDLPELTRVYNHYVTETSITFDIAPYTVEQRRQKWYDGFDPKGRHRCYVAEVDGRAVGWACSLQFRPKAAYDSTIETSIYLDPGMTGRGLGALLYQRLFDGLAETDVHMAVGGVTLPNAASVALHARFGFRTVGIYHEVGWKQDRYWDVQWFEKRLKD